MVVVDYVLLLLLLLLLIIIYYNIGNVDLYVANHESADLLYEEQVGDASSTSNESGQDFVQFRSLSLD